MIHLKSRSTCQWRNECCVYFICSLNAISFQFFTVLLQQSNATPPVSKTRSFQLVLRLRKRRKEEKKKGNRDVIQLTKRWRYTERHRISKRPWPPGLFIQLPKEGMDFWLGGCDWSSYLPNLKLQLEAEQILFDAGNFRGCCRCLPGYSAKRGSKTSIPDNIH